MTDTPKPAEARKEEPWREAMEQRLAEPPVRATGTAQVGIGSTARRMDYDFIAQYIPVLPDGLGAKPGEPEAAVFTLAYLAKGSSERAAARPVLFAFNGGPGSSSVWLHLGALGPKRVHINEDGTMPAPPYAVEDNPHSWFEHFDLVFIDPPHTGYSVSASEDARKRHLSVDGDVSAWAEVMRAWLARHQRFGSPVYLAGESYGTTRGAALADKMLDLGVALSGLILVSCAMDLQTLVFQAGNDLPYSLFLPGFAATAQYHGKLKGTLNDAAAARVAAEAFVLEDYLVALHRGASLTVSQRSKLAKRIGELTGLPAALVEQQNLRITDQTFFTHLLRDEGRVVGRLESRVSGPMAARRGYAMEFDPGIEAIVAPYASAVNGYFAQLGIDTQRRYGIINGEVNQGWHWGRGPVDGKGKMSGNGYTNTTVDLSRALRRNPHLRVMVASGHYDLGTPYSATNYSLAQLDVDAVHLKRIEHHYYDAGHMMYTRPADLKKLKDDLAGWLARAAT